MSQVRESNVSQETAEMIEGGEGGSERGESPTIILSTPHVLAMSATPIPRTLALAMHGDMTISQVHMLHDHFLICCCSTLKGTGCVYTGYMAMCMNPQQVLKLCFIWFMVLSPYLAQQTFKVEVKLKSFVTILIRYTWYVFESRSFLRAQISL